MKRSIIALLVGSVILSGCGEFEPRKVVDQQIIAPDEKRVLVTIVLDMSGSFAGQMADQGKAYGFARQVVSTYFRETIGGDSPDKILICCIGGTNRSLLWQGTPAQLMQEFGSADAFRDFLRSRADNNGSRVHDSIRQSVEYLCSDPGIKAGTVKSAVFVLSDMLDNHPDSEASLKKMVEAITKYGKLGGSVGLYYVDQLILPTWREHMGSTGMKSVVVEGDFVGRPNLPNLD